MRDVTAVDEENIEQAVVVVVEERNSPGHGFDQIFLRSRRVLQSEVNPVRQFLLEHGHAGRNRGGY